jgi:hypothetical protein
VHPLYTNSEHIVLSLFNDLEFFKQVYFRLIEETTKNLIKSCTRSPPDTDTGRHFRGNLMWDPLEALLFPYKYLMYITSDLLLWQKRPLDKDTVHNKFAVVYDGLKEIHTKLHESITPLITSQDRDLQRPLNSELYHIQSGLTKKQIETLLDIFEHFGLVKFVEPVLDVLWKISYPVLSHLDPMLPKEDRLYASIDREALKDWRNIISESKEFNYIHKTTQSKNLGKLLS